MVIDEVSLDLSGQREIDWVDKLPLGQLSTARDGLE